MARFLIMALALFFSSPAWAQENWAVYYTDKLPAEAFSTFDTLVFDSDHHPPIAPLKAQGKTVLGYISLGEAEKYRSYFPDLKKRRLLMNPNPKWKGHVVIDIRKEAWAEYLNETLIPAVLAKGFDGIMLDTADSVIQPELDDPKRYHGMRQATIDTIRKIRQQHPHILIMLNRGFSILPEIARDIDMVMAESIYTDWQPGEKTPGMVDGKEYGEQMSIIQQARSIAPQLKIYTIDYWPAEDTNGVKFIYAHQREQGFIPYVGTLDLQTLHPEP